MEKTDAYVVMTNNAINIVTTDPNVADQAKSQNPGSIVKRFPLTAKMQNGNGIVGEALDGDFDTGEGDGSIGADDVEFVDGPPPGEEGDEQPMDDMGDDEFSGEDENADVICMDTELAVRVFEYIAQNQVEGEDLQAMADMMADLGNQSDDVLTMAHFDEITGGDQGSEADMGDEFGEDDFPEDGGDEFADDGMQSPEGEQDVEQDLEIGEADELNRRIGQSMTNKHPRPGQTDLRNIPAGNYPGSRQKFSDEDRARHPGQVKASIRRALGTHTRPNLPEDAYNDGMPEDDYDLDQDDGFNGTDGGGSEASSPMSPEDEALWQQFANGEISREEFLELLSQGPQDDQLETGTTDPYGDDVSGDFAEFNHEGDEEEFDEGMDFRLGEDAPPGQQQQNDPTIDAQYMNGYNTGKRGGQATPQNMNTPQGSAYNSGFSDAKGGKPAVPPSKRQNEAAAKPAKATPPAKFMQKGDKIPRGYEMTSHGRIIKKQKSTERALGEGVETFAAFLSKIDKPAPGVTTVAALFKAKKQSAKKAPEAKVQSELVQDPATTAVKIVNPT